MFLPSNGAQDSLNKIVALASAMQAGEGDEILDAVGGLRTSLSDIVALVRHSLVGSSYIAEAKGHRSKGASVSDALRRLADAIDGARPGDSVASLADRLTKAEHRLDYLDEALGEAHRSLDHLAAAMREVANKDSDPSSMRLLASTIALNLGSPSRG